jgi:hypothetical protein
VSGSLLDEEGRGGFSGTGARIPGDWLPLTPAASWPVACIIDPSLRDRMRVDWTPGRDIKWDSWAETCWGT